MTGKDAENILTSGFVHTIKDPLWGNIPIESGMRALLSIPAVEKLSRIKQNGPAYRIYPGAVHTRLSHSIGVYHIGRRMLAEAAMKGHELPFSECGMKSFRAACLLHDIGHFPYAHSLKELSPKTHEEIASELIADDRKLRDAVIATGADPQITGAIINTSIPSGDAEILFYRHVLSGTLDPDKLDYLSRDAFFAGVPYGKQDTDFIISSLSYADSSLVLNEEALSLVEQVLFSKYMMYRSLYWHKGVRSATCMIKKAIISAIDENIITFDALYLKDDDEFRRITERYPSFKPFSLIDEAEHGRLFERKAMRNFDENGNIERKALPIKMRAVVENEIYDMLKRKYTALRPFEVIIDIPEPISFETKIRIKSEDGLVRETQPDEIIFSQASNLFSRNLRKTALYLPQYIDTEDARMAFMEADRG